MSTQAVVVGMVTWDVVLHVDGFPVEDQKYICKSLGGRVGGCAANVALNLSLLGMPTELLAWIGNDEIGATVASFLKANRLSTRCLQVVTGRTLRAFIFVNTVNASRTAFLADEPCPTSLSEVQEQSLGRASLVYYDGSWSEVANRVLDLACSSDVPVVTNYELPSEQGLEVARRSQFVIASCQAFPEHDGNDAEAMEDLLGTLWGRNHRLIGITRGCEGASFYDGKRFYHAQIVPVSTVDTTGAGDAFHAGLLLARAKQSCVEETVRFASAVAAMQCCHSSSNLIGLSQAELLASAGELSQQVRITLK